MKIIAITQQGYIVEMPKEDLAAIVGEAYFHSRRQVLEAAGLEVSAYSEPEIIGREVAVSARFRRVLSIESEHANLNNLAANLKALANMLETVAAPPLLPEPAT